MVCETTFSSIELLSWQDQSLSMKRLSLQLLLLLVIISSNAQDKFRFAYPGGPVDPYKYEIVKSALYSKAAVSSAHPIASKVGAEIMRMGGNAFDAAIATQWALAVVYPGAGNIGGGGFLLARKANGELVGIDYREAAPGKAHRDMYLDANGNAQINLSQNGHLASGIPGTVAGLEATMAHAKLKWENLIQPAIDLAEFGFVLSDREANSLNTTREAFLKNSTKPTAFVKPNMRWRAGDTLVQKELAATLRRIQLLGAKGFYEGQTAELIVAEMERGKGLISLDDLKNYKAKLRTPISFNYKGHQIISFAPPSSGGILLAQMMKMVQNYPLSDWGFHHPKTVQLMIEAERRAYADRAEHMGDPDFWKVPVKTLISDAYVAERMKDYTPDKAGVSSQVKAGFAPQSEETTHLSVMDKDGNMVAVTTTLNGGYGSRTVVGGAGFILNNEMDDFSIKPGVPNMYGAVGGEANAIAPGKRMLSSMTPSLVVKDGKPLIVVGTPGGTTIPTSVYQTILNIIDFNMSALDAVNKPKFHHQWLPDEVYVERDFPEATRAALTAMGYKLVERSAIGRTEVIKVVNGKKETAADKRGDDSVAGY